MAIQPIKFLVSPSATATNGSKTITVTGNVDCSHVYSGTAIALGTRQVVEAVSGTKPDGSGNSVITLRDSWADPTTTAKLVAFNTIEGLAEAIRRAREVVQASEAALSGNVSYMGDHSAATGNYPVAPGEGLGSQIYRISIAGTISEREYKVGELIYYDQYFSQWRTFFDGLGSAAQRNIGSDTANVPDNARLNVRLGTTGNLGNAATKTITASKIDRTSDRLLKVGVYGIGSSIESENIRDLDSTGFLSGNAGNPLSGTPDSGFGNAIKLGHPTQPSEYYAAIYRAHNEEKWYVTGSYGQGPQPWRELFHQGNVLGLTSFAPGGTPSGAIIERGSNANGQYIKLADGTLICWHVQSTSSSINVPMGSIYRTDNNTWTYPSQFSSAHTVSFFVNESAGVGRCWGGLGTAGVTASNTSFTLFCAVPASPATASLIAVGRWY